MTRKMGRNGIGRMRPDRKVTDRTGNDHRHDHDSGARIGNVRNVSVFEERIMKKITIL